MKKKFKMENLECAHCAGKMEEKIKKINGVQEASISFMTQKLTIEAEEEDFEAILAEADKIVSKIESDCRIIR